MRCTLVPDVFAQADIATAARSMECATLICEPMAASQTKAAFVEPMLLLRTDHLPEDKNWQYEIKLDGFRSIAFKSAGKVHLRSRNDKDFNGKYPGMVKALAAMPDETVIDGEIVALDSGGRPSFNALQNRGAGPSALFYYVFDVILLGGTDVTTEPLTVRRGLLQERVLVTLDEPIRESPVLEATLPDLVHSVKAQGLEGLVAKRCDSRYEPGVRSGAWQKMRVNQAQEFVIGGYTPSAKNSTPSCSARKVGPKSSWQSVRPCNGAIWGIWNWGAETRR
jgi:ATP-dependent DNA ligase